MLALVPHAENSVRQQEVPEPQALDDQVVVEVAAISINRGETFQLERSPDAGWRPGKDVAGTVVQAASSGRGPAVGTRVVGHSAQAGWAERAAVDVDAIAELPDCVSFPMAAALPLAGLTALRLLRAAGPLLGTRLLITGASGGVGHYVTELAVGSGAAVTAVTGTPDRGARLVELGAAIVTKLTDVDFGHDVGLESVGGESLAAVRRRVKPEGRILWFGQASREPVTIDFFDWIGDTVGAPIIQFDYTRSTETVAADLATLVSLVEAGRLHPELDRLRDWSEAPAALDDLRHRKIRGNLVLEVGTHE